MKLCIFGAGAVGSHLAAKLAKAGVAVSIVARPAHVEAIRKNGLRLISPKEEVTVAVTAVASAADLPPQDFVLSTVKAHALPAASLALAGLSRPGTSIVYIVNGIPWWYFHRNALGRPDRTWERLDPGGALWNVVGVDRALGGVIYSPNEVVAPGVVRSASNVNRLILGEPCGDISPRLSLIAEILGKTDIAIEESTDIRLAIWRKLLINLPGSAIACLTGLASNHVAESAPLRELYSKLNAEGSRVAESLGIRPDVDLARQFERMRRNRNRPSMLQDLEAGRSLETDAQLVAVQDLARTTGVETPILDSLVTLLLAKAEARASSG